jgi:hypothetical protein
MADRNRTPAADADARAVLARLAAYGAVPESVDTIDGGEVLVSAAPDTTPAEGMALLRAMEDDPDDGVRVERSIGHADLIARVAGARVRLRVRLRLPRPRQAR